MLSPPVFFPGSWYALGQSITFRVVIHYRRRWTSSTWNSFAAGHFSYRWDDTGMFSLSVYPYQPTLATEMGAFRCYRPVDIWRGCWYVCDVDHLLGEEC